MVDLAVIFVCLGMAVPVQGNQPIKDDPMKRIMMVLAVLLAGCAGEMPSLRSGVGEGQAPAPALQLEPGTFSGLLPCADCAGIDTTLTLWQPNGQVSGGTYELRMAYQGKPGKPWVGKGAWLLLPGDGVSRDAVVCELVPDDKSQVLFFKKTGERGDLQMLDHDRKPIKTLHTVTLRRVKL
jgi:copper homeostasis protein (lipoprotein)